MHNQDSTARKTVSDFVKAFSCSYAMAGNMSKVLELENQEVLSSSVIGFGSGLATMGDTCGAVSAAIAVLGARFPETPFAELCCLAHDFYTELERRAGAATCGGVHGGKHLAKNFRRAILTGKTRACTRVIRTGVEILAEIDHDHQSFAATCSDRAGIKAIARHFEQESFHCCRTTVLAIGQRLDLPVEGLLAPSQGFCGGIGFNGTMCGAISGGVLCLGLAASLDLSSARLDNTMRIVLHALIRSDGIFRDEKRFPPAKLYAQCREVYHAIEKDYGSAHCRQILGLQLDIEEDGEHFIRAGMLDRCRSISRTVAGTVADVLTS